MVSSSSFPLDFSPSPTQDTDLLRQVGFIPGLKELLMLRQVHALEHGTVWVLSEMFPPHTPASPQATLSGGMSTDQGFYLFGQVDPDALHHAVHTALRRFAAGEWNLAVHPHCGTNLSVNLLLTAGLALGFHLLLPKDPIGQILGIGLAATTASQLSPDLGSMAQRYITTAIPFNLMVQEIHQNRDRWGHAFHFVKLRWVE